MGPPNLVRSTLVLIGLSLLAVISCDGKSATHGYTVTDSAGVTIVENGAELLVRVPTWYPQPTPTLQIETSEATDLVLFNVTGITVLQNGRTAVVNSGGTEVLLFSEDGTFLNTIGRTGEGPGEFRTATSVVSFPGDSISVYDSGQRRLSVFDAHGGLGREVSLRDLTEGFSYSSLLPLGAAGFAVTSGSGFGPDPQEGIYRVHSEWFRIDGTGHQEASFGRFPGTELFASAGLMGPPLFAKLTSSTTADGNLLAGTGEAAEFRTYGPSGDLTRVTRWAHEPEPVTEEMVSAYHEKGLATLPEAARAQALATLKTVPRNEFVPPFSTLLSSSGSDTWVGSYAGPGNVFPTDRPPERSWLVFNSAGVLVAKAVTPEGFEPYTAQGKTLLGVFKDDMGVESVRAYRFVEGEGS